MSAAQRICTWLVLLTTLAIYARTATFEFINLDDDVYISQNDVVRRGLTLDGLRWSINVGYASNWHPLTWWSHMFDAQIFGDWAGGHHLTNVLLHVLNTALVVLCLQRATGATWPSICAGAMFALHPLRVESVAWVSERKDVLCTFFTLVTILAYIGWCKRGSADRYLLMTLLYAAALASKPMAVTLPVALLLLDRWPLQRLDNSVPSFMRRVAEKLPLIAMSAGVCALTLFAQSRGGALMELAALSSTTRVSTAVVALYVYLQQTTWPASLAAYYPHPAFIGESFPLAVVFGGAVMFFGVTALCIWTALAHQRQYLWIGWSWFLVMLLPVIGLVQVGAQLHADRYTYLPQVGVFVMVAWGAAELVRRRPALRMPVAAATVVLLVAWSAATAAQVSHWRDSLAVASRAVAVTDKNWKMMVNLGGALAAAGRDTEALVQLQESLAIHPSFYAHLNIARLYLRHGRIGQAAAHAAEAVRIKPADFWAQWTLAEALEKLGQPAEAMDHLTIALKARSQHPEVHNLAGLLAQQLGRDAEAAGHFRRAADAGPDQPEYLNNAAWMLATHPDPAVRDGPAALALAQRAAELTQHRNPVILSTLAAAQAEVGRFDDAVATSRAAIALVAGQDALLARLQHRLRLYETHRPYRQDLSHPPDATPSDR